MKRLHKLIKKATADIETFSYNTTIPAFMVATGELAQQKCRSRRVLEPLVVLIAPFCPHIAEELWQALGHETGVCDARWPELDETFLVESSVKMPVKFKGKLRNTLEYPTAAPKEAIEKETLANEQSQKYLSVMQVVKVVVVT